MYYLASVDPGIHTAIAFWKSGTNAAQKPYMETFFTAEKEACVQLEQLYVHFDMSIKYNRPSLCVIEGMQVFGSSAKSMASATRGNLSLLAYIVGMYIGVCFKYDVPVALVEASKWKGQMPYPALRRLLKSKYGWDTQTDHEAAAIGIGLHHQERF